MSFLLDFINIHPYYTILIQFLFLIFFSTVLYFVVKKILLRLIHHITQQTDTQWDNILVDHGVFDNLPFLAPSIVWYYGIQWFPRMALYGHRVIMLFILYNALVLLEKAITAFQEIYNTYPGSREHSIKSYIQSAKLFLYFIGCILALALILNKPLTVLLSGIGALTAILLLIFKDSILSFIAGLQIASNDMFRVGDWIEMPQYNADGTVIDIALHKVKIQNWDKTIVAIPTFKFIDESFKNWRGMTDSGGRRIKRALFLNQNDIRFCDETMLERWKKITLLKDYLLLRLAEVDNHNQSQQVDPDLPINGRKLTNLGTFRRYALEYIKQHPQIHKGMPLMVRQLPPSSEGLGIEIYAFSIETDWFVYESIQADIFDHLIASLPTFDLHLYQKTANIDLQQALSALAKPKTNEET